MHGMLNRGAAEVSFISIFVCSKYQYIIWLNSSVRGPFLPAYVKRRMHWTEALTDRLKGKVKMVGATINCGGAYDVPAVPHVQSYLVALDLAGFRVLQKSVSLSHHFIVFLLQTVGHIFSTV